MLADSKQTIYIKKKRFKLANYKQILPSPASHLTLTSRFSPIWWCVIRIRNTLLIPGEKCNAGSSHCSVQLLASSGEGGQATEVWLNSLLSCPHTSNSLKWRHAAPSGATVGFTQLFPTHAVFLQRPVSLWCVKISEVPRWGRWEDGLVSRAGHPWQAADSIVEREFAWFRFSDCSRPNITCLIFTTRISIVP